jgi:hypothetical protein
MGDFGGILLVWDGTTENLVRDYDADYDRRAHKRQIARGLRGWMAFLAEGRDFRLMPDAAWTHRSMSFDAHFDGDFWFYFRSREEMTRFKARYESTWTMRRVNGEWRRIRLTPLNAVNRIEPLIRSHVVHAPSCVKTAGVGEPRPDEAEAHV